MWQLLSNATQFARYAKLVAILPLVLRFVEEAEAAGGTGPEKRKMVIKACQAAGAELVRQGYVPGEFVNRLDSDCEQITDLAVTIYNTTRVFKNKKAPKKEKTEGGTT